MTEATRAHAATLGHLDYPYAVRVFVRATPEAAEDAASAALLAYTAEYRDTDEHPDDAAWLDFCWEDGWEIWTAVVE